MNDQSTSSPGMASSSQGMARGAYRQALAEAQAALDADGEDEAARLRLAKILLAAGDPARAHAPADLVTRFAIDWQAREEAWRIAILTAPFAALDVLDLRALSQRWSGHLAIRRLACQPPPPVSRPRHRELWIAYILDELPPGTRFLPLEGHDPAKVRAHTFWRGLEPAPDPRMVDLSALTDRQAADRIRSEDPDLMIDLCRAGTDRGDLLAMARPARIQIGWVNRLLPDYDYGHDWLLGDALLCGGNDFARDEGARRHLQPVPVLPYVETGPHGQTGATPKGRLARPDRPDRNGPILANLPDAALADDACLAFWADLAARLPRARFVVWTSRLSDLLAERIADAFERRGIATDRMSLVAGPRHPDDLAAPDLLVDGPALSGTEFDTLAACRRGTPVVAVLGDRLVRRRAAAILHALGQEALVVHTGAGQPQALAGAVLALADDPRRLRAYGDSLPRAVAESGLADPAAGIARLEEALGEIWQHALAAATPTGRAPV